MAEIFLALPNKEQFQILSSISKRAGIARTAQMLEKDIWICWALEHLFKMPNQLPMAFKGGTSLSKVFRVIQRFSEDIDITIDYQAFNCGNPFADHLSQSQLRKMTESIRPMVTEHIKDKIMPYYAKVINESFKENLPTLELDNDGETLFLHYHSVIKGKSGYVQDSVKLEFGGRNLTIPSK